MAVVVDTVLLTLSSFQVLPHSRFKFNLFPTNFRIPNSPGLPFYLLDFALTIRPPMEATATSAAVRIAGTSPITNRTSSSPNSRIALVSARFTADSVRRSDGALSISHTFNSSSKRNAAGQTFCSAGVRTYEGDALKADSYAKEERIGVLLLNLGGPETLHDVQPFLFNLFADPDIIRLPRPFRLLQRPLAKMISVLRAPKSREGYAAIGGGSPLRKITDEQANALKKALEEKKVSVSVYVGMRYWYPFTEEAIQQIKRDRITRLVVLPLYPHFSIATTGSSLRVIENAFREDSYLSRMPVSIIRSWYQRDGYVKSMADLIQRDLESFSKPKEVLIFFSAHGVPVSYIRDSGDPYKDQMEESIYLIMQELKSRGVHNDHRLAYQSRVGPVQWLTPYTDEVLVELGQKGLKSLLAVPVSFVSEHIETLEEIDMEYRELALKSGIENWGRVPALGCTPSFITDLADAVIEALPSATAMMTSTLNSETDQINLIGHAIRIFFGSILAFVLLLSPKMLMAFRNQLL